MTEPHLFTFGADKKGDTFFPRVIVNHFDQIIRAAHIPEGKLQFFNSDGSYIDTTNETPDIYKKSFLRPIQITTNSLGEIFVTDQYSVTKFRMDGSQDQRFLYNDISPSAIAVGSNSNIFISDYNSAVHVFSA